MIRVDSLTLVWRVVLVKEGTPALATGANGSGAPCDPAQEVDNEHQDASTVMAEEAGHDHAPRRRSGRRRSLVGTVVPSWPHCESHLCGYRCQNSEVVSAFTLGERVW